MNASRVADEGKSSPVEGAAVGRPHWTDRVVPLAGRPWPEEVRT